MALKETGAGKRLYELRLKQNKTMDDVAKELNDRFGTNITRSHISRWERELNEPSLALAKRLCEYYEITADYLLGLPENPDNDSNN